jgi:putative ABC transport system permease protein
LPPIVPLSVADLFLAGVLVLAVGALSVIQGLGLERRLVLSALRMTIQLATIGYLLKLVFAQGSPWWTALLALVMVAIATYEAGSRPAGLATGRGAYLIAGVTLLSVGVLTTSYVTAVVISAESWSSPHVFLPILGMILGNALTAVALALRSIGEAAKGERAAIEARLALGQTRGQAFRPVVQRTLATALMPTLNSMAVAGVVSLPGMMTGQILAGADPVEAAKYQIMIMFAIGGSSALAAAAAVHGAVRLVTDGRDRLRPAATYAKKGPLERTAQV